MTASSPTMDYFGVCDMLVPDTANGGAGAPQIGAGGNVDVEFDLGSDGGGPDTDVVVFGQTPGAKPQVIDVVELNR